MSDKFLSPSQNHTNKCHHSCANQRVLQRERVGCERVKRKREGKGREGEGEGGKQEGNKKGRNEKIHVEQKILGFKVAVDDAVLVKETDGEDDLRGIEAGAALAEISQLAQVVE